MKKIIACILAAVVLLTLININGIEFQNDSISVDDKDASEKIDQQKIYDELFDINSTVEIDIDISKEELAKIQSDYERYKTINSKSPIYRMADSVTFTVNGKKYVIKEVGIRMKGNESRVNFYNDLLGVYNLVNFRLSFHETFDDNSDYIKSPKSWNSEEERSQRQNRTFATLSEMEIKWNTNFDNTYVRNIYASDMFLDYGILTQNCHLASLSLGGAKAGVYKMFEPVDEIFLTRYLPKNEQGGDLYKASWVNGEPADCTLNTTYGVSSNKKAIFYSYDLKTNQLDSQHQYIKKLLEVINNKNVTKSELESVIDIDYFLRFCALNYMMGNQDDLRNNYNNYYIYFRPSDGKAIFIPYDCEWCFGSVYAWNPTGSAMTGVSPYSDMAEGSQQSQVNPLINLTVASGGMYKEAYTEYLQEISKSKWMTGSYFKSYYDIACENYSQYIISNINYLSTMGHNIDFSLEGGADFNDSIEVSDFMREIKQTVSKYTE